MICACTLPSLKSTLIVLCALWIHAQTMYCFNVTHDTWTEHGSTMHTVLHLPMKTASQFIQEFFTAIRVLGQEKCCNLCNPAKEKKRKRPSNGHLSTTIYMYICTLQWVIPKQVDVSFASDVKSLMLLFIFVCAHTLMTCTLFLIINLNG